MTRKLDRDLRVVVLVPNRPDGGERDTLWEFARTRWARDFPDWPIVEGVGHVEGPFNRASAVNEAAGVAGEWDVAVIIDADVVASVEPIRAAVALAYATDGPVLAYHERVQLNRHGTQRILNEYNGDWKHYRESASFTSVSSAVVVSRDLWDQVGGFDEMFDGWGWEDNAFIYACETVSELPLTRIASTLYHLWHRPSPERDTKSSLWKKNKARGKLYEKAHWDREMMTPLLDEASKV